MFCSRPVIRAGRASGATITREVEPKITAPALSGASMSSTLSVTKSIAAAEAAEETLSETSIT